MTKTVAEKLSDLIEAVRALPEDSQEAIIHEFADRVADFTQSHMSEAQVAEVERRLALPRRPVLPRGAVRGPELAALAVALKAFRERSPTADLAHYSVVIRRQQDSFEVVLVPDPDIERSRLGEWRVRIGGLNKYGPGVQYLISSDTLTVTRVSFAR
jgi:hypothetical protein